MPSTGTEHVKKAETVEDDFMNEVDELLLEQELLSPTAAKETLKTLGAKKGNSSQKSNKENKSRGNSLSPEVNKTKDAKEEKLRDSMLEKLLNGEQELKDIVGCEPETEEIVINEPKKDQKQAK